MENLPSELLVEIFNRITNLEDKSDFSKTCKRFNGTLQKNLLPTDGDSAGLRWAVKCENEEMVKEMLSIEGMDPSANFNECICTSVESGNYAITKLLIETGKVDLSVNCNQPLRTAKYKGYLELEELIKRNMKSTTTNCGKRTFCVELQPLW